MAVKGSEGEVRVAQGRDEEGAGETERMSRWVRGETEQGEREIEREQGWRKERANRAEREREWREKSRERKKGAQWERGCGDGERE